MKRLTKPLAGRRKRLIAKRYNRRARGDGETEHGAILIEAQPWGGRQRTAPARSCC